MVVKNCTNAPIFIVGMNGSGTTLMLNCMNAHHQIYGFPRETQIIPYYVHHLKKYGDLRDLRNFKQLWTDFGGESCFRWENGGLPPEWPERWKELPRSLATVIDETFGYFARKNGKARWCEKTPMHAQHIATLYTLFPEACFVHMIRDGRDCAASFHRRWGYIPERTIYRWKNLIKAARHQANECGAMYIEVRYEELTRDPLGEMERVCHFVDVPFDDQILSPSRKPKHSGSNADAIVDSAPRWRSYFTPTKVSKLEGIAGRTLCELGYEVGQSDGDTNPGTIVLGNWMLRDYARMAARALWKEVRRPRDQKWDDLTGRIRRAIRQRLSSRF